MTDRTLGAREALARAEERRVAAEASVAALRSQTEALSSQLRLKTHEARTSAPGRSALPLALAPCPASLREVASAPQSAPVIRARACVPTPDCCATAGGSARAGQALSGQGGGRPQRALATGDVGGGPRGACGHGSLVRVLLCSGAQSLSRAEQGDRGCSATGCVSRTPTRAPPPVPPVAAQAEQLEASKAAREQLQERLLEGATDHRRALEERVSAEVAKLQAAHKADTERLRQETIGSFTREVNMLREMRDTAVRGGRTAQCGWNALGCTAW